MNPITLLISFAPWILFGIIPVNDLLQLEIVLVIALILSILLNWNDLKQKLIVPLVTFVFFVVICILIIPLQMYGIIPYISFISNAVLTVIGLGSLAVGVPFTIQYAKKEVPKEKWTDPNFFRINQVMTGFWGFLFLLGLLKSTAELMYPDYFGTFGDAFLIISMVIGIVFTMKYPPYARKKLSQKN